MVSEAVEFSQANLVWLLGSAGVAVLLVLLVASFSSRPQVFCQYLKLMARGAKFLKAEHPKLLECVDLAATALEVVADY